MGGKLKQRGRQGGNNGWGWSMEGRGNGIVVFRYGEMIMS